MNTRQFEIGLHSWIIQDGNYGDFHVGQRAEFAVEFYPESVRKVEKTSPPLFERVGYAAYRARGPIVHLTPKLWILDLGILVFQESAPPKRLSVGDVVEGVFHLGVDPFFYFERLYGNSRIPPMIQTWQLRQILIETAPFIESREFGAAGGRRYLERDPDKLEMREIAETDAWEDDNGSAEYVFVCELLDSPPKRESVTAYR